MRRAAGFEAGFPDLAIRLLPISLTPDAGGTIFVRSIMAARSLVKCHLHQVSLERE